MNPVETLSTHDDINPRRRVRGPGLHGVVGRVPSRGGTFGVMHSKAARLSRRQAATRAGLLIGAALAGSSGSDALAESKTPDSSPDGGFLYCLNTATVRGQKLGIAKEIEVAAKAGYQAIEPWVDSIEEYKKTGGSLPDF